MFFVTIENVLEKNIFLYEINNEFMSRSKIVDIKEEEILINHPWELKEIKSVKVEYMGIFENMNYDRIGFKNSRNKDFELSFEYAKVYRIIEKDFDLNVFELGEKEINKNIWDNNEKIFFLIE
mmetsp:Transcript_29936/g.51194  ORF Transcript_29936/g.51194 Transcript_29936/m.51194 type:complete len:123 (-) Transcript_29936:38-406(-)